MYTTQDSHSYRCPEGFAHLPRVNPSHVTSAQLSRYYRVAMPYQKQIKMDPNLY